MQKRCPKTDAPWTEEEFDPNDPRILDYSYWRRCPKDFLPVWVAPHPTRGWICLACDVHAQVGHCTSERHLQRVVKSQADPDWFEWFLEEKGNLELANMNPRVGSLLYITLANDDDNANDGDNNDDDKADNDNADNDNADNDSDNEDTDGDAGDMSAALGADAFWSEH